MMTDLDQKLLDAIFNSNEDSNEPRANGEPDPPNDQEWKGKTNENEDDESSSIYSDGSTFASPRMVPSSDLSTFPTSLNKSIPPWQRHNGPQTGPKGVLADYKWHQKQAAFEYDFDEDLELLDPDFFEQYKKHRIQECLPPPRPLFGNFREIHVNQFIKEIDSAHPFTPIIIHLFHRTHPACILLNQHFIKLAKKYKLANFLRLVATEADPDFDPIAYPTIQVYKQGKLMCNLIRVTMELANEDEPWEFMDLERLLKKHKALTEEDILISSSSDCEDSDSY